MAVIDRCSVVTEMLGGSPLSRAARAGQVPSHWYRPMPNDLAAWRDYARHVASEAPREWLSSLRGAFGEDGPRGAARDRLERSAAGRGIVLTTGQQPGLFGGPLMTFNKALSARAFADVLRAELGVPVAPVFWAATDDADFDEAAVAWIATANGAEMLRMARTAPEGVPMSAVPIGADVEQLVDRLRSASGSVPDVHPLDQAVGAYSPGRSVGDAYVALLRDLLEPLGIAVLDASHPAVRAASAPVLTRAIDRAEAIGEVTDRRIDEIRGAGFEPQVDAVPGLSLVFTNDENVKRRLPLAELRDPTAHQDAGRLSPTVLLRPVVERSILPTAAYVAGPGEYAYFAQVSAVAQALDVPVPLVVARWSATIIEPRVTRGLSALGLSRQDLRNRHAVEASLARGAMPGGAVEALHRLREDLHAGVSALAMAIGDLIPSASLDGLRNTILHRMDRTERRIVAAVKRRETELMQRIAALSGALYPDGAPQERRLTIIPLLARYGDELLQQMLEAATEYAREVIVPSGEAAGQAEMPLVARP